MKQPRGRPPSETKQEYALVYSTDRPTEKRCLGCRRPTSDCVCGPIPFELRTQPVFRLEKKGRGGKVVTVIDRLPKGETHLEALCALLKRTLGCGGTWYVSEGGFGVIELQGDRRSEAPAVIAKYQGGAR